MDNNLSLGDLPNDPPSRDLGLNTVIQWETFIAGMPMITVRSLTKVLPHEIIIIYGGTRAKNFRKVVAESYGQKLARLGYTVHCFDFRSNLEGNNFYDFGLHDRLMDAVTITNFVERGLGFKSLTLVGVSMGGHLATRIAPYFSANNLILVAPAAYHDQAVRYDLKFSPPGTDEDNSNPDGRFSRIIRGYVEDGALCGLHLPWGWKESGVFSHALRFGGSALVIRFDQDEVVAGVPNAYFESFVRRGEIFDGLCRMVPLPGPHGGTFSDQRRMADIVEIIANFVGA